MSADWELETAALAVDYRAMEVAVADSNGHLTGSTMPVVPVEYTQDRLVVAIPHTYATWLPPVLFRLTDGDGEASADGTMVTGCFLVLGAAAAESMSPASGGSGWVEDGRWPQAASVMQHVADLPDAITHRQVVMAGPRWHDGGLPPTEQTVGPYELEYTFHAGLGNGPWAGLLALEWPLPEPLQEPPHDATDLDGEFLDLDGEDSRPSAGVAQVTAPVQPSKAPIPSMLAPNSKAKGGKAGKATTAQRLDSMHDNVSQLTDQVSQLTAMLAKMQATPKVPSLPPVQAGNPYLPPPRPCGPPPQGYNPFLTSTVGEPARGLAHPIPGTPVFQASDLPRPSPAFTAGMMGPPIRGRMEQSGTSILDQNAGAQMQNQDIRGIIASVLQEVGVAPKSVPGQATSSRPDQTLSRDQIREAITSLFRSEQPNLLSDTGDVDVSGARGAVAYAREKSRFENNPLSAYNDFRTKARRILGRGGSQPTTFKHLMTELPFGQMNNRKRISLLLLTMLDEVEAGNIDMVKGLLVQAMRWIILDLENPRDPLTSWRLTFQPDPIPMQTPVRSAAGLDLNNSLLDPSQLTSTLGMSRDMELLSKRLKGQKEEEPAPRVKKGKGKGDNDNA